jgi:hypothetical protein
MHFLIDHASVAGSFSESYIDIPIELHFPIDHLACFHFELNQLSSRLLESGS